LTFDECARAAELARQAERAGIRVVNRPGTTFRRFDLLHMLHASGHNPYAVHRTDDTSAVVRFPAFVRLEREHTGPQTDLLPDTASLRLAINSLLARGLRHEELMVAEYVDMRTPVDGLFRKYSVMRVGPRLIPRHALFSTGWVEKIADIVSDATLAEEQSFLDTFPHRDQVSQIFDLAHIDYGRIDYGVLNGRVVTWEINTNPTLMPMPERCDPRRLITQSISGKAINAAILELDGSDITLDLRHVPPVVTNDGRRGRRQFVNHMTRLCANIARLPKGRAILHALRQIVDDGMETERQRRR
jgi:hypothetical protein